MARSNYSADFEPDGFGIINEMGFNLQYPRAVDDTAPTLPQAVQMALQGLIDGAEEVSVVRMKFDFDEGIALEDGLLISMTATDELEELGL